MKYPKGSSPGDGSWANDYDNFQFTKTQGQILDFWTGRYQGINLSNQVITHVPRIEMNEDLKKRMIAEATFLRAFHYLLPGKGLWRCSASLSRCRPDRKDLVRASLEETWDFIESDLRAAIPKPAGNQSLPTNMAGPLAGRPKDLLAKVLMYREDWAACKIGIG